MSMLAEPRRKQKWSLNPRGKQWSDDSNKFGQKMLEKMGWTSGKGLGANEQGMTEHVKISLKNDQTGIGYKDKGDQWTQHQTDFDKLLSHLQESNSLEIRDEKDAKESGGTSLEFKSKQSRARVHYHKFTRGKDVNKYSNKDLANIFGKKDLSEGTDVVDPHIKVEDEIVEPIGSKDTTAGVVTIKGGDMTNYFKSKVPDFMKRVIEDSDDEAATRAGFGYANKENVRASKEGFVNLALNLNREEEEPRNGMEFEVSRAQFGLENTALDLSDESSKKKRVTFNDKIEYNTDVIEGRKGKAKLDKFEVDSEKLKRKLKLAVVDETVKTEGFVNEALDVDMVCDEICDNELNERKSKKSKKKKKKTRRMSNLETIPEVPEETKESSIEIISEIELVTLDQNSFEENVTEACESVDERRDRLETPKKKKVKRVETEVTCDVREEIEIIEEEPVRKKSKKKDARKKEELLNKQTESKEKRKKDKTNKRWRDEGGVDNPLCDTREELLLEDVELCEVKGKETKRKAIGSDDDKTPVKKRKSQSEEEAGNIENCESPIDMLRISRIKKSKKSKRTFKAFFAKSPVLHFMGSNINEIKGYGFNVK